MSDSQPIALRRSRRSITALRRDDSSETDAQRPLPACTPSQKSRQKRVRFSDPGPILVEDELSTGLTPMIRRTSLNRGSRRQSTPSQLSRVQRESDSDDPLSSRSEVHFLPLRQVLDGRVKRRIRRNGLSEEMNSIYAEKRRRAQETKEEIERLKTALAEKDEEIRRMQDETVVFDTERVWELEQQVAALQRELASHSGVQRTSSSPNRDWTLAARDPFSDDFMDIDDGDDAFGDTTVAELACSTPSRRARASFPTPPTTSPAAAPRTPSSRSLHQATPATPCSHIGVQTSLPDPEKQALEDELASLRLEITKLTATLESYSSLTNRLSDRLSPYPPLRTAEQASEQPHADMEERLSTVLQTLSDRTAALLDVNRALTGLGFPGGDALEVVASLSSSFRAARLELEYLTPGELTLPLTAAGAAVLDAVLERLRDLAKKNRESDDTIDEYHAIELSLRQQLGARVDAMEILNKEVARMEGEGQEKDVRIAELEVGLDRLKSAVSRYTRDVSELESLVQRMESELETSNSEREQAKTAYAKATTQHSDDLASTTSTISDLEAKLSLAVEQTATLRSEVANMQTAHANALGELRAGHKAETTRLSKAQGQALALRDARVAELRLEIDRVNEALRKAHENIRQLRVENGKLVEEKDKLTSENIELASKREVDRLKAKQVIDSMKAELERVVRMSEGFLAPTPKKPKVTRDSGLGGEDEVSLVVGSEEGRRENLLSGELARKGNGKKRRRYDSGLGFLDEGAA